MPFSVILNIFSACLLPKLYDSDVAFIHLKRHDIIPVATFTKHWKNYINTFTVRNIIKEEIFDTNVLRYFHNFQMSNKFIILGNKVLTSKHFNEETCKCNSKNKNKSLEVKLPTGKLHLKKTTLEKEGYEIIFNVDKTLALNITFLVLKFYMESNLCDAVGIEVVVKKISVNKSNTNKEEMKYFYCKQYAAFNFYPKFNALYIKSIRDDDDFVLPFQLYIIFSVIDKQFESTDLVTKEGNNWFIKRNISVIEHFHLYKLYGNCFLISYQIQVNKIYQIIISLLLKHFTIFDGPGFTFPIISSAQNIYITSTYQCIIQHIMQLNNSFEGQEFSFTVKTMHIQKQFNVTDTDMLFKFPDMCENLVCITKVTSGQGYQVNFTLKTMYSMTSLGFACLFWGLVVVEEFDSTYEESKTICETLDHNVSPSRSFYSVQPSLFIVIVNYQNSEHNTLLGVVSKTRCQPVHIDPCLLRYYHCDSTEIARMYISNLSEFTDLDLSLNNRNIIPIFFNYLPRVFYNVPANSCAVIQIGNRQFKEIKMTEFQSKCSDNNLVYCELHLSSKFENTWIVSVKGGFERSQVGIMVI